MLRIFFAGVMIFSLAGCTHADRDALGYYKPPPVLLADWQNSAQYEFTMKFLPGQEFRIFHKDFEAPDSYYKYKIFRIEDDVVYAIVREVWNPKYPDAALTPQEIEDARANFLYMKFDLSGEPRIYDPGKAWLNMLVYTEYCPAAKYNGFTLSAADFDIPVRIHWQRIQPNGPCQEKNGNPPFSDSFPYAREVPWSAE